MFFSCYQETKYFVFTYVRHYYYYFEYNLSATTTWKTRFLVSLGCTGSGLVPALELWSTTQREVQTIQNFTMDQYNSM